jgi:hypothetical protein
MPATDLRAIRLPDRSVLQETISKLETTRVLRFYGQVDSVNAKTLPSAPISIKRGTAKPAAPNDALINAIVETVAYADIFDYPLTAAEIHRYLIGRRCSRDAVQVALDDDAAHAERLCQTAGFYTLAGREAIATTRQQRLRLSTRFWPRARRYGRMIASLPFVKMVAVTGELAMDNVRESSDIDYFIVTEHRRLWLCRLFVLGIVHVAARFGDTVCPNYLLSERMLALSERDLYSAHEVVQMVPLSGFDTYARFRQLNQWVYDFLPNAVGAPRQLRTMPQARPVRAIAESALRTRAGALLERWESGRKMRKFAGMSVQHREASFSLDWCKGHVHDHSRLILAAFEEHKASIEGNT